MTSFNFLAEITSFNKITVPKTCREKLELAPGMIYYVWISKKGSYVQQKFLARLHKSGQIVVPKKVFDDNGLKKGEILSVSISTTDLQQEKD